MMLSGFWHNSSQLPLDERALGLMMEFPAKKALKMKEWLDALEKIVEREILLAASLGKDKVNISIDIFVHELEPLSQTFEGVTRYYDISETDKTALISELKRLYTKKEKYGNLKVSIDREGKFLNVSWERS